MFTAFLRTHDLRGLLAPRQARAPFPAATNRAAWEALPARAALLRWGGEALAGYPPLTATQYLAYARTGDRQAFEQPYFLRRTRLIGAALAACAAGGGAYLDAVIDGVWHLCEETGWVVSAHGGAADGKPGHERETPLPQAERPDIDLFAAQTGATLAYILSLLGPLLDGETPMLRRRVQAELEKRILTPFMTRDDFWWMGFTRKNLNNWTPWILSNVIDTFLLTEESDARLAAALTRAMQMLDRYLACQPEDGGCDEGCGYWNMAGASLLDCLESLRRATGGAADFYGEPLIRRIAAFPLQAHIAGEWYWNFADCDAKPHLDGERVHAFGLRTGNPALAALGYELARRDPSLIPQDTPQMSRVLNALFNAPMPAPAPDALLNPPVHSPAPDVLLNPPAPDVLLNPPAPDVLLNPPAPTPDAPRSPVMLPRLQVFAFAKGDFYAAIKGGHNDESHNHNDVGSVIVYHRGEPCALDAGNLTYTKATFSAERYTLWNTRAAYHNLPIAGGAEQREGARYRAENVQARPDGARMALAAAYPPEAGLLTFERSLAVSETAVTVTDALSFAEPKPVQWVWMLRHKPAPAQAAPGYTALRTNGVRLTADAPLQYAVTEIPVTDARMARSFPGSLWRVTLLAAPATAHLVRFTFSGDENHG